MITTEALQPLQHFDRVVVIGAPISLDHSDKFSRLGNALALIRVL
jgi:hypothetical protein